MTRQFFVSAAALAVLAGATTTAFATDMNGRVPGGMKDGGAMGVPVPAPMPYEETYKYYIGGSLGWTFSSKGTSQITTPGAPADPAYLTPGLTSTVPVIRDFGDVEGPGVFSIFAGRYLTPSIRTELSLDIRDKTGLSAGPQAYSVAFTSPTAAGPVGSTDINVYGVTRQDDVSVRNNTLMINAYYDFNRGGRLTPYIGAGVGLSMMRVTRSSTETSTCLYGLNDADLTTQVGCFGAPMPTAGTMTANRAETQLGLAASLMAGASIALSQRTHWDIGYRLMYQGGTLSLPVLGLGGNNVIKVGDRLDHEIRTGLRFDIW